MIQKGTIKNIKNIVTSDPLYISTEILDMQFPNNIETGEKGS